MIIKRLFAFALLFVFLSQPLFSKEEAKEEYDHKTISKVMGHLIGRNLKNTGISIDQESLILGIQESFAGKKAPLSENECIAAISKVQEKALETLSQKNLLEAEQFLTKNAKNEQITKLEDGKVQYLIEKKGIGECVKASDTPLLRYTGKYLDGTIFGATQEPEKICLEETILGFRKAVEGMKEGEVRTIYIHPNLGYGKEGLLQPNSLLTYEVELIQANFSELNSKLPENLKDKLISTDTETQPKEEKVIR